MSHGPKITYNDQWNHSRMTWVTMYRPVVIKIWLISYTDWISTRTAMSTDHWEMKPGEKHNWT